MDKITGVLFALISAFIGSFFCSLVAGIFLSAVLPKEINRLFSGMVLYGFFFVIIFLCIAIWFWKRPDLEGYSSIGDDYT